MKEKRAIINAGVGGKIHKGKKSSNESVGRMDKKKIKGRLSSALKDSAGKR